MGVKTFIFTTSSSLNSHTCYGNGYLLFALCLMFLAAQVWCQLGQRPACLAPRRPLACQLPRPHMVLLGPPVLLWHLLSFLQVVGPLIVPVCSAPARRLQLHGM